MSDVPVDVEAGLINSAAVGVAYEGPGEGPEVEPPEPPPPAPPPPPPEEVPADE